MVNAIPPSQPHFSSRLANLLPPLADDHSVPHDDGFSQLVQMPGEDAFKNVQKEKLTAQRFPDWFVLTTLSQSFKPLSNNGVIPISTLMLLRDQFYHKEYYREARVVDQLIQYKKVLTGSGAPWLKPKFKELPGYSWADIQWLREKVKAGQDLSEIVTRYYDHKSREAMYRANWADVINVPLTLLVGILSLGTLGKVGKLGRKTEQAAVKGLVK